MDGPSGHVGLGNLFFSSQTSVVCWWLVQLSDVASGFIAGPVGRGVGRGLGCLLEEDVELQRRGLNVSGGWVVSGEGTKKAFASCFGK